MIEFRGRLDRTLYRRALAFNARPTLIVGAILTAAGLWAFHSAPRFDTVTSWAVPLAVTMLGVNLLIAPWRDTRTVFRSNKLIGEPFTGRLDENRFLLEASFGKADLPWSAFHRASVSRELVLLYVSKQQFYMLTRRFFDDDAAWEAARELVQSRVKGQ
jgi:hypothetical protein